MKHYKCFQNPRIEWQKEIKTATSKYNIYMVNGSNIRQNNVKEKIK